ncbi:MAG: hypothetical protein D3903_08075 [Candidatus Electrothrix sp. GM3_4]|nr:hypothetical protein [Candidatus Electrothrix sp. GM3_4]
METTYRKRFRLKQNAETVFPTTGPDNAPGKISTGSIEGANMGRNCFTLQKVSKVSNGLEISKAPVHGNLSKVSNISGHGERKAYLDDQGRLRIPLAADDKYRFWSGGQSVFATLLELGASDREIEAHTGPISTPESWRQWQRVKAEREAVDSETPA